MTTRNPVEFTRQSGLGNERVGNRVQLEDENGNPINAINPSNVAIPDGADVAQGATTDAAVDTDTTGTISGKLRGLVKILADVWDGVNNFLNVNLVARYGSGAGEYDEVRIDASTNSLQTIEYEHHEIHSGSSYTVADTVVADTTTIKWMIVTPDTTKYSHLVFTLTCTGEATFLVTEGADRNAGTPLSAVNRRRVGTPAIAATTVSRTPTGGTTDGAVILFSMRNGITNVAGKNIEGSQARATNEWILAPNTKYIVSITTYADVFVTCILDWYEHTDKH